MDEMALREAREAVVREHMDSENEHRFDDTLGTFDHPRYELMATGETHDGADEVMDYFRTSRAAFPDQRNDNVVLRHADDAIVVEFDLHGTHLGELRGIPPTGRTFRSRMCALFLFEPGSDRIVCERIYFDQLSILQQLTG
ncbi:ester cyclase [Actinokineospora sp.]|uniref:ester cyclase n=1 Tax=Actinokineospora sp. TaxID=1872133 RepID=UPI00403761F6